MIKESGKEKESYVQVVLSEKKNQNDRERGREREKWKGMRKNMHSTKENDKREREK